MQRSELLTNDREIKLKIQIFELSVIYISDRLRTNQKSNRFVS